MEEEEEKQKETTDKEGEESKGEEGSQKEAVEDTEANKDEFPPPRSPPTPGTPPSPTFPPSPPSATAPSSTAVKSSSRPASGQVSSKTESSQVRLRSEVSTTKKVLSKMLSSVTNAAPAKLQNTGLLGQRNPFIHDPPYPEERRPRIENPRTPKEYIINLREDLADFQESHGLPRSRDYSFMSLGLALAQEIIRAIYSLFLMLVELLPIIAIISLLMRFALDKLIEIFETPEPVSKIKKSVIFALEMVLVIIPIWILIVAVILPLASLVFSAVKRALHFRGSKGKLCGVKSPGKCKSRS